MAGTCGLKKIPQNTNMQTFYNLFFLSLLYLLKIRVTPFATAIEELPYYDTLPHYKRCSIGANPGLLPRYRPWLG